MPPGLEWLPFGYLKGKQQKLVPQSLRHSDERLSWLVSNLSTRMVVAWASATASASGQSGCDRWNFGLKRTAPQGIIFASRTRLISIFDRSTQNRLKADDLQPSMGKEIANHRAGRAGIAIRLVEIALAVQSRKARKSKK